LARETPGKLLAKGFGRVPEAALEEVLPVRPFNDLRLEPPRPGRAREKILFMPHNRGSIK